MYHTQSNNSFPMLFSIGNGQLDFDEGEFYSSSSSSSSSSASVDCTLSLGTPSTRGSNDNQHRHEKKLSSSISNFGWNILPSKHAPPPSSTKAHRTGTTTSAAGDPLLARRCANCDTTSTPLWRNGPRGPKSLCNACGIRYKKEERRATAAAAAGSAAGETQYMMNGSWAPANQKSGSYSSGYSNEYRSMEDDDGDHQDSEMGGAAFMSWRFNVTDRTSFVHDFTR